MSIIFMHESDMYLYNVMYLDVGQLQNFTNTALISHCEDGATADLIKDLEIVGTKLAPFIYHLKPTAGINELIDCCKRFRMDLDDLQRVSQLLVR